MPVQTNLLSDAIAIAAGSNHSMAVDGTGNVWAWGNSAFDQLGRPMPPNFPQSSPGVIANCIDLDIEPLCPAVAVAAGSNFSLAVRPNREVWGWGRNELGELGNGTDVDINYPVPVLDIDDAIAIDGGDVHSVALLGDGTVRAWGSNFWGQLGDGTSTPSLRPVTVVGLDDVIAVAAGSHHTLALRADGTVWAWGRSQRGALGNGTINAAPNTVPVLELPLSLVLPATGLGIIGLVLGLRRIGRARRGQLRRKWVVEQCKATGRHAWAIPELVAKIERDSEGA